MMSAAEEYNENEVLTGAELYLYLLRQNEEQQERARSKLREYSSLKDTLQVLTERSRRRVLAPVAGGLAYFPAELNSTNTILVLLGDSWFAERSAAQAAEIAGRRLDFLRREAEVLQQEQTTLRSKQELFLSEMPEAQDAVAQLLAEKDAQYATLVKEAAPPCASPASSSPSSAPASTSLKDNKYDEPHFAAAASPSSARAVPNTSTAPTDSSSQGEHPSTASPEAAPVAAPGLGMAEADGRQDLDYSTVDDALATFDEEDGLTEDELIALEMELGDRLDDDEYVEQVMMERMIEKKERRVRAELKRLQAAAAEATKTAAPAGTSPLAPHSVSPQLPAPCVDEDQSSTGRAGLASAAAATTATYRTPGDIGEIGAREAEAEAAPIAALHAREAVVSASPITAVDPRWKQTSASEAPCAGSPAASPTTSTCSSSSRKEKHVHFRDEAVQEVKPNATLPASVPLQDESPHADDLTAAKEEAVEALAGPPTPSLLRSTYRIGDIVEHLEGHRNVVAPPPPLLPTQRQKPKRKSLFMRDLDGDEA